MEFLSNVHLGFYSETLYRSKELLDILVHDCNGLIGVLAVTTWCINEHFSQASQAATVPVAIDIFFSTKMMTFLERCLV